MDKYKKIVLRTCYRYVGKAIYLPLETRRSLLDVQSFAESSDILVIFHLYYVEYLDEIVQYLGNIRQRFDLYVSVCNGSVIDFVQKKLAPLSDNIRINIHPNRGRDVAPFLALLNSGFIDTYQYVCKIHAKGSVYSNLGSLWRNDILNELLGTPERVDTILGALRCDRGIGLVGPTGHRLTSESFWGRNKEVVSWFCRRLKIPSEEMRMDFFAGTMFWFKPAALAAIKHLRLSVNNFEHEQGITDGTVAHALERMFTLVVKSSGYLITESSEPDNSEFDYDNSNNRVIMGNSYLKYIALYLPQFHAIPENDEWWGEGFTEWTNTKAARPFFDGHYQPHEPVDELGYYDLTDVTVMIKQAELAKSYGIYGFCYYYYWFNGRTLLEKPLLNMLATPEVDIPFCLCWANHNWTRSWDAGNKEILLEQTYDETTYTRFIDDLYPYFLDKRYIRIDSKPVLIIYQADHVKNPQRAVTLWRSYANKKYGIDLYLIHAQQNNRIPPGKFGYDAVVEFAPNYLAAASLVSESKVPAVAENVRMTFYDYQVNAFQYILRKKENYKVFRCVYPMWDNTARRKEKLAWLFLGATPEKFKNFLIEMSKITVREFSPKERFLFINAWNEWAEGTHLEPCRNYGYRLLEICKEVHELREDELMRSGFDVMVKKEMEQVVYARNLRSLYLFGIAKIPFFKVPNDLFDTEVRVAQVSLLKAVEINNKKRIYLLGGILLFKLK